MMVGGLVKIPTREITALRVDIAFDTGTAAGCDIVTSGSVTLLYGFPTASSIQFGLQSPYLLLEFRYTGGFFIHHPSRPS